MGNLLRVIALICLLAPSFVYSQGRYRKVEQRTEFTKEVMLRDSVRMDGLGGGGTFIRIDENGWLYKGISAGGDSVIQISNVQGLLQALQSKQDTIVAGDSLYFSGDTLHWTGVSLQDIVGLIDSLNTKQKTLQAGQNITIVNDTISATGSGSNWQLLNSSTISPFSNRKVRINNNDTNLTSPFYVFGQSIFATTKPLSDTIMWVAQAGFGSTAPSNGLVIDIIDTNANMIVLRSGADRRNIKGIDQTYSPTPFVDRLIYHQAVAAEMEKKLEGVTNVPNTVGVSVFDNVQDKEIIFRRIRGVSGVTVSEVGDEIRISSNISQLGDTAINVGDGRNLFREKTNDTLVFKTIKAGTNVTIDTTDTTITINSSGGSGGLDTIVSVGSGNTLISGVDSDTIKMKSISSNSSYITVANNNDEIIVDLVNPSIGSGNRILRLNAAGSVSDFQVDNFELVGRAGTGGVDGLKIGDNLSMSGDTLNSSFPTSYTFYLDTIGVLPTANNFVTIVAPRNTSGSIVELSNGAYIMEGKVTLSASNEEVANLTDTEISTFDLAIGLYQQNHDINTIVSADSIFATSLSKQSVSPIYKTTTTSGEGESQNLQITDGDIYTTIVTNPVKIVINNTTPKKPYLVFRTNLDPAHINFANYSATLRVTRVIPHDENKEMLDNQ